MDPDVQNKLIIIGSTVTGIVTFLVLIKKTLLKHKKFSFICKSHSADNDKGDCFMGIKCITEGGTDDSTTDDKDIELSV